ncbi:SusD/RagB family nutrient-binding outer membrane lipoprotein [Adhaeribacter aquaticus]|uniref:SusD/RagB family nutrient-binding outer membrane lipoprotein n=1 Tax=Adhaeribacter aquaticus TaxID=299567 RepID=UPI00040A3F03|nr:SusD/RagB family nutrient-binding outer membrane lipoprotein [Adhaeribacter aquaticus]
MKKKYIYVALFAVLLGSATSCDKDFEDINTNKLLPTNLDANYLLTQAQIGKASVTTFRYEGSIVQQVNTALSGVLEGGNRNTAIENNINPPFNEIYLNSVRQLVQIIEQTKDKPELSNVRNLARIWKAYDYMTLVDTYGSVPYFDAARGFLDSNFRPEYDDDDAIYEDLIKELEDASKSLNATTGGRITGDLVYAGDVVKNQRFANSLLLRAGMRYTKVNPTKAAEIVKRALAAPSGVITNINNSDDAFIRYNTTFINPTSSVMQGNERSNYYAGKAFIDYLQSNNDPRLRHIAVKYEKPAQPLNAVGAKNTNPAEQIGMPFGFDETTIVTAPGFPGRAGAEYRYSQFNRETVLRNDAPEFLVTAAQTNLLLAEAAVRGFITGAPDMVAAKTYYENGIRAHMNQLRLFDASATITPEQQNAYIMQSSILFDPTKAIQQINEQYWVASFRIWNEAWANFRRTGFPQLNPINFPFEDPSVKGAFIRKLPLPLRETQINADAYKAALGFMGGTDNLATRVFWDKQ